MARVRDTISEAFAALGRAENLTLVAGSTKLSHIASEFAASQLLFKLAKRRYEAAKLFAKEQGVLGNEADYRDGEAFTVWSAKGSTFNIACKRGYEGNLIDRDQLRMVLIGELGPKQAREILAACEKERKASTEYMVVFND